MEKSKLQSFINRYYHAGNCEAVTVKANGQSVNCELIDVDQTVVGKVKWKTDPFMSGELGINHTGALTKMLSAVGEKIDIDVQDKDFIVTGNDGGSAITALTLDMSAAGAATFNNDVTAFSDARLKDNVETIPNALETVCAMRGVNFTRNDNNDQPGTGVIAQEMQEVFPVVVKENNDEDNTLSVSYGNLVGVLIESIKELKAEIDELKGN